MSSPQNLRNVNIVSRTMLATPQEVHRQVPISAAATETVAKARTGIEAILDGSERRLFLVVGPCSIHDMAAAREYAGKLSALAQRVSDEFLILMRVYFEKPRTTVGWKGFLNDPHLNDSFAIQEGIVLARQLLVEINAMNLGVGTEALDPVTPQFLDDVISWYAIGARTVESQTHRELASGLSAPVGFKNSTDGSVKVAVNALKAVSQPHHFLGITYEGQVCIFHTAGNRYGHIVLRGGTQPNYDSVHVALCEQELANGGLPRNIMIDCSHGNSNKDPKLQPMVFDDCISQVERGNTSIKALMLESNLAWGNQELGKDKSKLAYGVSITDACIDWATTEKLILDAAKRVGPALKKR